MEVQRSTIALEQFKKTDDFDNTGREVLIKTIGLQDSLGSNFDYNGLLNKSGDEFRKKWQKLQPSPHHGKSAYPFEDFPILGLGKFGTVHMLKSQDSCLALKVLKKEKVVLERVVDKTIMERKILEAIEFPFIVALESSCKDNDFLYLGLQFIGGGDLFNHHRRRVRLGESETRFYTAQILLALEYLHNIKCLYRDLKLENILIDFSGYIKLTDFGLAKFVEDRTTTLCGTPEYIAPEMLQMKPYGKSVDWWSYGILIYELVAGFTPFASYSNNLVVMYSKVCEGCYQIPNVFSADLKDLVMALLNTQHATRLGALCNGSIDIKNHRFFRSINWRALMSQKLIPPYRPNSSKPCDTMYFQKSQLQHAKVRNMGVERSERDQFTKYFEDF